MPASLLLDVQDDLHELFDILRGLPGLRQLYAKMKEVSGQWPVVSEGMDNADLIDLGAAPDVILSAVQCRLNRIAALLAAL